MAYARPVVAPTCKDPPYQATAITERRAERRLFTLLRTGKLLVGSRETICRVRNISANGFMADVCPAPRQGEQVVLELSEGNRFAATIAWTQCERVGATFAQSHEVSDLVDGGARGSGQRNRAVRITPDGAFANLICDSLVATASVLNISQTGVALVLLDATWSPPSCDELRIEIDGLGPVKGALCRKDGDTAGIRFSEPIAFETLSHWLWATWLAGRQLATANLIPSHRGV